MQRRPTKFHPAVVALIAASACATAPATHAPLLAPSSQQVGGSAFVEASAPTTFGLELQAYPAGTIAGLHAEYAVSERDVLTTRLAWNETDRGDFGEHDHEHGGGPGIGVGWRRFLGPQRSGWLFGGRVDLWALEIDWEDDAPAASKGTTDVVVAQPALEFGHRWRLGRSGWSFDLTGSFGVEINVDTDGEDVGDGPIGLLGATLTYGN